MKKLLSAVIITKNEEQNIARCLESVIPVADEVLVIDSFSTDRTEEICLSYPVRFIQHEWQGFALTKNLANSHASHDWILSLDADEVLSPELRQSIIEAREKEETFFAFRRLNNYCGQWIRHSGWYPDIKPRLFDRRTASWQGNFVHEKLVHEQKHKPQLLEGDCLHYTYTSIKEHADRSGLYAQLSAEEHFRAGKRASWFRFTLYPWLSFFKIYVLKLGFLDGRYGFVIAFMYAYTRFLRYAILYGLGKKKD